MEDLFDKEDLEKVVSIKELNKYYRLNMQRAIREVDELEAEIRRYDPITDLESIKRVHRKIKDIKLIDKAMTNTLIGVSLFKKEDGK